MRFLAILTSIILGIVFLYSGITKLYPIEPFEYSFVELGAGWKSSLFLARLMIGFEFACSALLILNLWLKRFTIPLVAIVLLIFCGYLGLQIIKFGNTGNCGCFGTELKMTPLEGIIKNILMLGLAAIVYFFHRGFQFRFQKAVTILLITTSLVFPFILNPVNMQASSIGYEGKLNYKLDLDILYNDATNAPPKVELREGKWVIAFFSLTCQHCRTAAKKLHLYKKRNPEMRIHMILNGDEEKLTDFFEETRSQNISWSMFIGLENFLKLTGSPSLPQIFWVNNSTVENKSNYLLMEEDEVIEWFNK